MYRESFFMKFSITVTSSSAAYREAKPALRVTTKVLDILLCLKMQFLNTKPLELTPYMTYLQ